MHDTSAAVPLAHTAAYQIDRGVVVADPSERQIERHIQRSAKSSLNVTVTLHAQQRMRQRQVTNPMLLEVLRLGQLALAPEADMTRAGLICRMQRYVAGVQVAVVVAVEYPAPSLTVVTVIDVRRG